MIYYISFCVIVKLKIDID